MSKLARETPVYIPCSACGKVQHSKLRWAQRHNKLECEDCGEDIDLKQEPALGFISKTGILEAAFEKALDVVHAQAKRIGKSMKGGKGKSRSTQSRKGRRGSQVTRSAPTSAAPVSGQAPL